MRIEGSCAVIRCGKEDMRLISEDISFQIQSPGRLPFDFSPNLTHRARFIPNGSEPIRRHSCVFALISHG
jgi:hypothetical protein